MPKIGATFRREQVRWSDIGFGPVDGGWPAVSFAAGTTAWSQLKKLADEDVILAICAGQLAEAPYRRQITGISVPHYFTAPTRDLVKPEQLQEASEKYGENRWPDSIACRAVFRILHPPLIDNIFPEPRLITGTRGRYLADLSGVTTLYDQLAGLEIEELDLYKSARYIALAAQPRQTARRQAGWTPTVPKDIQGFIIQKVRGLFASERASGGVYEYIQPTRKIPMDETPLLLMLLEMWEAQEGRCDYCRIPLETQGLAQLSIDRIDNDNREYGRHNVHLTCWECNRGKGAAAHEEMVALWEKRKLVWSDPGNRPAEAAAQPV